MAPYIHHALALLVALSTAGASPTTPTLEKRAPPLGFTLYDDVECRNPFSPAVTHIPSNPPNRDAKDVVYQTFGHTKAFSIRFDRDLAAGEKLDWFMPAGMNSASKFDPSTDDTTDRCAVDGYAYIWNRAGCFSQTRYPGGWEHDTTGWPLFCFKLTEPENSPQGKFCGLSGMPPC